MVRNREVIIEQVRIPTEGTFAVPSSDSSLLNKTFAVSPPLVSDILKALGGFQVQNKKA